MRSFKTLALLAALALAGCAIYPSGVDQNFGASVKSATALQVVNPGARAAGGPLALDGQAAKFAIDRYNHSFEQPPTPQNVLNIGIGTGSSGTSVSTAK